MISHIRHMSVAVVFSLREMIRSFPEYFNQSHKLTFTSGNPYIFMGNRDRLNKRGFYVPACTEIFP